ncbi:glutamate--tRNA ligase [Candidatus Peregrinibacteria bacterium]|nr:MAG: glutamate--tRNA ligase [Candidatus Peregrinibacteria bacterium]
MSDAVIVRFPPSPTGLLHIGTVRTCLYNYLFAKKHGGKIIFRFEDTDRERSTKEYEENILSGLTKMGIVWNEGPYYQTERTALYQKHLEQLLEEKKAYHCFCTPEELATEREEQEQKKLPPRYSGKCGMLSAEETQARIARGESSVIRFRVPQERGEIPFSDLVRGEVSIHVRELSDFVIAKTLETALYNFAVVVDDHDMNITHIIRGEDHISNTPKQILIFEAFGWKTPAFAHLPLILNTDRSKLSKRKNKVSVDDFLAEGFLPEALLNYLALLGWNTADEKEIFSLEELTEVFSLDRVQKGGAIFDIDRLTWMNGVYLRQKTILELKKLAEPFLISDPLFVEGRKQFGDEFFQKTLLLVHERLKTLGELPSLLQFFFLPEERFSVKPEQFPHQKMKVDESSAQNALETFLPILESIPEDSWNRDTIEQILLTEIRERGHKNGEILWPIRVAITGEAFSPGAFEILDALGKSRSIVRIRIALASFSSHHP